jgi:hypothetical protein
VNCAIVRKTLNRMMRMDDLDDLLGPMATERPRRGRPAMTRDEVDRKLAARTQGQELESPSAFLKPVTLQFLSQVFGGHSNTIQKRLSKCPVAKFETHKGSRVARYNFLDACKFLVEPNSDIADWIKSSKDFPPDLQKAFWAGQRERQRWQKEAGELWHTEDVIEVLGRTFIRIKEASRQWADRLPDKDELTTEQYKSIQGSVQELLDEIHQSLVEMPVHHETASALKDVDAETDEGDA